MPSFFIKLQYFIYLVMKINLLNRTQNRFVFCILLKAVFLRKFVIITEILFTVGFYLF